MLRSECLKKHCFFGVNFNKNSDFLNSLELFYDHSRKTQGIWGHPISLVYANKMKFNESLKTKHKLTLKEDVEFNFGYI